jgi:hypothetical protein
VLVKPGDNAALISEIRSPSAIALAVLGLREDDPKRLLSGEAFQISGHFRRR